MGNIIKSLNTSGLHPNTWIYSQKIDITTSAPQKLWRYIIDAIVERGYGIIFNQ